MFSKARFVAVILTSSALVPVASIAHAQVALEKHDVVDENGVDQLDGTFQKRVSLASIGSGDAELALIAVNGGDNFDYISAGQSRSGGVTTITIYRPNEVDRFTSSNNYSASRRGTGAKLVTNSDGNFTYIGMDGSKIAFGSPAGASAGQCANFTATCSRMATSITSANGRTTSYNYFADQYCRMVRDDVASGPEYDPDDVYYEVCDPRLRLGSVSNNAGYRITFQYQTEDTSTDAWMFRTGAYLSNDHVAGGSSIAFNQGYTFGTTATGQVWSVRLGSGFKIEGVTLPGEASESITIGYGANGVSSVTRGGVTTNYSRSTSGNFTTAVRTDANGKTVTTIFDRTLYRPTQVTDELGRTTTYGYTTVGLLQSIAYPEGNQTVYAHDARGNVTSTTIKAKPAAGLPDIVSTAGYAAGCSNDVSCNSPIWLKDANQVADPGKGQTDYTYEPASGLVASVTAAPAASGGARPQVRYGYTTAASGARLLTSVSACRTTSTCTGTADESRVSYTYNANDQVVSVTRAAGDGSAVSATSLTYDWMGNIVAHDGPLSGSADTTLARYDADRRLLGIVAPDPDGAGPLVRQAQRLTYSPAGRVTSAERGTVADGSDAAWTNFAAAQQTTTTFDQPGRRVADALVAGGTTYGLTQYSYDALGRPLCTAVRLNGFNADACAVGQGANGPDRVTKVTGYDDRGRAIAVTRAFGTAEGAVESVAFTENGRIASQTDAEGNKTSYGYDGYDRLSVTQFPSATSPGTSNAADYEQLTYDANGNATARRLRDGTVIGFAYDALGRVSAKVIQDGAGRPAAATRDVFYGYDLLGSLEYARFDSATGEGVSATWDALGRMTAETSTMGGNSRTVSHSYDAAGNRTRITHPDGVYFNMGYDALNRLGTASWWQSSAGTVPFLSIAYDQQGRRGDVGRGASFTGYAFDPVSRLGGMNQRFAGNAGNVSVSMAHNPAGQIIARSSSNDDFTFKGHYTVDRDYTANGLNQ